MDWAIRERSAAQVTAHVLVWASYGTWSQPASKLRRYGLVVFLALVCAILGSLLVREKLAPSNVSLSERAGGLPEEMRWFWGPFLPPAEAPLVVIPNHPLLRAAHGGDSPATLNRSPSVRR